MKTIDKKFGTLYVVATPIGNLGDITLRALQVLKLVDLIACEDTRHAGVLLKHFEIKKPLVSYFQHSRLSKLDYIANSLQDGQNIALITDAGTPGISDPGQELVNYILKLDLGIKVVPIPGSSALNGAVSVSGMVEKEFYFAGFLPKKKGRQTKLKELANLSVPVVVYESANRLERSLGDILEYFGSKTEVFIAREMTKVFEEYWRGNIEELTATLNSHTLKGEIVLIIKKTAS